MIGAEQKPTYLANPQVVLTNNGLTFSTGINTILAQRSLTLTALDGLLYQYHLPTLSALLS